MGDSGGPLVYLDPTTNRFTQVALVSYGPTACGSDPRPSVNTDVYAFNSWIQKAIAAHEGHLGIVAMKQKVWWPGIDAAAEKMVVSCHLCHLVGVSPSPEPMSRRKMPEVP
ncbi:unnamed protein product [Nezara viridula]|uniref:Uncharacterized protein n=1 Tax=Nezara viridula TaxID=85310 RepID=A0A9P0HVL0_NEZVI|nr:unnamed protein product [Nezara viridula]